MRQNSYLRFASLVFCLALALPLMASEPPPFAKSAGEVQPLLIGSPAPNEVVHDSHGKTVDFKDVLDGKPTVVIFYRGSWCPYCSRHLAELQDIETKLVKMGMQIVAISPDSHQRLTASEGTEKLNYTLYSDASLRLARSFGIAFQLDQATIERYKTYKISLPKISGHDHNGLPVPSVFIVDAKGKIHFSYVNPDYSVRLGGDVVVAAAATVAGS